MSKEGNSSEGSSLERPDADYNFDGTDVEFIEDQWQFSINEIVVQMTWYEICFPAIHVYI